MNEVEYGYMEGGRLISRFLSELREVTTDENGVNHVNIITVEEQAATLTDEWKPVERINDDMLNCSDDNYIIVPVPYDAGEFIGYKYLKKFDVQKVRREIETLKAALTGSDYQVTKCYEASLTGLPLPYDMQTLHTVRQSQRDRINELQAILINYPDKVITL